MIQHYWKDVITVDEYSLPQYLKEGYNVLYCYHKKVYNSHYIQGNEQNGWHSKTEYYESGEPYLKFVIGRTQIAEGLYAKQ